MALQILIETFFPLFCNSIWKTFTLGSYRFCVFRAVWAVLRIFANQPQVDFQLFFEIRGIWSKCALMQEKTIQCERYVLSDALRTLVCPNPPILQEVMPAGRQALKKSVHGIIDKKRKKAENQQVFNPARKQEKCVYKETPSFLKRR